jgi:hypothetical protein
MRAEKCLIGLRLNHFKVVLLGSYQEEISFRECIRAAGMSQGHLGWDSDHCSSKMTVVFLWRSRRTS